MLYSMEASKTQFFAFQFKPVLNLLDSPTNGFMVADEVGLGKTAARRKSSNTLYSNRIQYFM